MVLIEIIDWCYAPTLLNQNESITQQIYPEYLKEQHHNFHGDSNPGDILQVINWIFVIVVYIGVNIS